jgi:hypothetical protein
MYAVQPDSDTPGIVSVLNGLRRYGLQNLNEDFTKNLGLGARTARVEIGVRITEEIKNEVSGLLDSNADEIIKDSLTSIKKEIERIKKELPEEEEEEEEGEEEAPKEGEETEERISLRDKYKLLKQIADETQIEFDKNKSDLDLLRLTNAVIKESLENQISINNSLVGQIELLTKASETKDILVSDEVKTLGDQVNILVSVNKELVTAISEKDEDKMSELVSKNKGIEEKAQEAQGEVKKSGESREEASQTLSEGISKLEKEVEENGKKEEELSDENSEDAINFKKFVVTFIVDDQNEKEKLNSLMDPDAMADTFYFRMEKFNRFTAGKMKGVRPIFKEFKEKFSSFFSDSTDILSQEGTEVKLLDLLDYTTKLMEKILGFTKVKDADEFGVNIDNQYLIQISIYFQVLLFRLYSKVDAVDNSIFIGENWTKLTEFMQDSELKFSPMGSRIGSRSNTRHSSTPKIQKKDQKKSQSSAFIDF